MTVKLELELTSELETLLDRRANAAESDVNGYVEKLIKKELDPPAENVAKELSKDDLLRYVELELWGKFQERLWKIVGLVLTIVSVLGFLGVTYYIKNEVTTHLQDREKEFTERTNEVLEYSKALVVLKAKYDGERYRFDGDVLRLVNALDGVKEKSGTSNTDTGPSFLDPGSELLSLISRADFSEVVTGSPIAQHPLVVPENLKNMKLLPPTIFTISSSGISLDTGGKETHPFRDGTYQGAIKDLKYRIVILEALRRSIDKMQQEMLAVNNDFSRTGRTEAVTVDNLQSKYFPQLFSSNVSSIASSFLNTKEQADFVRFQSLYTLGYKVTYAPIPPQPKQEGAR